MNYGKIALNIDAKAVQGPRGYSIQAIRYNTNDAAGNAIYDILREDETGAGVNIGQLTAPIGWHTNEVRYNTIDAQGNYIYDLILNDPARTSIGQIKAPKGNGVDHIELVSASEPFNAYKMVFTNGGEFPYTLTNGASAYQIWLTENGYSSNDYTEADFLEAYRGYSISSIAPNGQDTDGGNIYNIITNDPNSTIIGTITAPKGGKGEKGDKGDKGDPGVPGTSIGSLTLTQDVTGTGTADGNGNLTMSTNIVAEDNDANMYMAGIRPGEHPPLVYHTGIQAAGGDLTASGTITAIDLKSTNNIYHRVFMDATKGPIAKCYNQDMANPIVTCQSILATANDLFAESGTISAKVLKALDQVESPKFIGGLIGDVTGNISGNAGTVSSCITTAVGNERGVYIKFAGGIMIQSIPKFLIPAGSQAVPKLFPISFTSVHSVATTAMPFNGRLADYDNAGVTFLANGTGWDYVMGVIAIGTWG